MVEDTRQRMTATATLVVAGGGVATFLPSTSPPNQPVSAHAKGNNSRISMGLVTEAQTRIRTMTRTLLSIA